MSKIFSRIQLTNLSTNRYLPLARLVLIQLLLMLRPSWHKVELKLYQRCFNVVSTSHKNVASTLFQRLTATLHQRCSKLDFVSFSTSDQRYFNVDPQCWNNVDPTLKCWLGCGLILYGTGFIISEMASWYQNIAPMLKIPVFLVIIPLLFIFSNSHQRFWTGLKLLTMLV